ncbi:MAG: RNA polymerase sigma-70 factor [Bacteroidota bacterium]
MSAYQLFSDSELIDLLKTSDHTAYTEIYERYYYLMFVFAYKKLRDEDLAKDFVQDLFINLWVKRENVAETAHLAPYLYVSLRNRIMDYFIHQKVEHKYIVSLKEASHANTDYLVRENDLKAYIEHEIGKLPQKMRQVFELSRKSNLTYKEIASTLSISEKTVHSQMVNALNRLRVKLGLLIYFIF